MRFLARMARWRCNSSFCRSLDDVVRAHSLLGSARGAVVSLALLASACGEDDATSPRAPVAARIACASAPAEALARMALGDSVSLVAPVPPDVDPAHWAPAREVVAALRDARLLLLAGAGLEAWSTRASLPPSRVWDAAAGTEAHWIELPVVRHTHGAGEEHSHEGSDPHVWLAPDLLAHQLARIAEGAARVFPDAALAIEAREPEVAAGVARYRAALAEVAPLLAGRKVFAAWPCYGYLGRALGCDVVNLALDPWASDGGQNDGALRTLESGAAASAKVLLWPAPPPAALAQRIEEHLGVRSVHFDALLRPPREDGAASAGFARLEASIARLAAVLR
jgi:zinc transport system substrate-binding protein